MKSLLSFLFIFLSLASFAQDENETNVVGILATTSSASAYSRYASTVTSIISKAFNDKSRFVVVDREKMDQLASERNLQKQEDFINGKVVAQGKSIGARYIVSSRLSQLSTSKYTNEKTRNVWSGLKIVGTEKYLEPAVSVNLGIEIQIIDVVDGSSKANKVISSQLEYQGEVNIDNAVNSSIMKSETVLKRWLNDVFPVYMKILKVESKDKKGLPNKVLIKGGSDMDFNTEKALTFFNSKSKLEVYYLENLTIDGKSFQRPIVIGRIAVDEIQGEFSICNVQSGAKEILDGLSQGKTLLLKVKNY